jgi:quinol monooxygenase YgiN
MYGMIAKLTAAPGRRQDAIAILSAGTAALPGCFSYVIAEDATEPMRSG